MVDRLLEDSGTKPWAQLYIDRLETYGDIQVNGDLDVLNNINTTGEINGTLRGDVFGNVEGDVEGDVIGNVEGNLNGEVLRMQPGFNLRLAAQLLLPGVKNQIITNGDVAADGNFNVGGLINNVGLVTIPANGRYMITASVQFQWNNLAANTRALVKLYVETIPVGVAVKIVGSEVTYIGTGAAGDIINMNLCGVYQLAAGTQMSLFFEVPNHVENDQIIHQGAVFSIQRLT